LYCLVMFYWDDWLRENGAEGTCGICGGNKILFLNFSGGYLWTKRYDGRLCKN